MFDTDTVINILKYASSLALNQYS